MKKKKIVDEGKECQRGITELKYEKAKKMDYMEKKGTRLKTKLLI